MADNGGIAGRRRADDLDRDDVAAALEVRRELGLAYEHEVVDSFADRIEQAIAVRVDARLAQERALRKDGHDRDGKQLALAITTLALGIPISAVSGGIAELPGLIVAWGGIAAINVAYAWPRRRARS